LQIRRRACSSPSRPILIDTVSVSHRVFSVSLMSYGHHFTELVKISPGSIYANAMQILAAAELLVDTPLNHSQISFLHTVQACGTSLVETVNHVLDFTKLSGNVKSGGVDNVITRSR